MTLCRDKKTIIVLFGVFSLKMMANTAEIIIFIMLGLTSVQEFMTDFAHNWVSSNSILKTTTIILEYRPFCYHPYLCHRVPFYVSLRVDMDSQSISSKADSLQWPVCHVSLGIAGRNRLFAHQSRPASSFATHSSDAYNLHWDYFLYFFRTRYYPWFIRESWSQWNIVFSHES